MKLIAQTLHLVRIEALLFMRYPKLAAAAALVMCIPALYVAIYLASVWDPVAHSSALPVALVNLDQDVDYREQTFNVGREISANLREKHTFGFVDFPDEATARRQVRSGQMAFALIFPRDFSSNAIPGQSAGAGKLVVYTSEGNNFQSAQIARNFANELGHVVNENLNARRWQLVLNEAAGSQRSVEQLHLGVAQLRGGARELSQGGAQLQQGVRQSARGMDKLAEGVGQLSDGMRQLGAGLRTLDSKRPSNTDLVRLKTGAQDLASGHAELDKGLLELHTGSRRLRQGVVDFRDEARDSFLVPNRVGDGLDQLLGGVSELDTGLQTASTAHQQLSDGAVKLSTGVDALANGVLGMNSGIRTMVSKLPEDRQLDEIGGAAGALATATHALAEGSQKMKAGSDRLEGGLDLLASSLPLSIAQPEGSAQGLANSVTPLFEVEAPVPNSGSAFGPNVLAAALWLGAGIAAFLVHVRIQPKQAHAYGRLAQVLGKMALPLLIAWMQALLVLLTVVVGLQVKIALPGYFLLTLLVSSLTFLAIVLAFTRAFGDAGKALAMMLLAVQLSASGGVLPVELSGSLYANLSPWLPLTWVVKAMKATMFGAYDAAWQLPLFYLCLIALAAITCACWLGRWRYVKASLMRPAVDF